MNTAAPEPSKPRFNPWPLGIVGLLLTVVVANVIMLVIATRNPPVMVDRPHAPAAVRLGGEAPAPADAGADAPREVR